MTAKRPHTRKSAPEHTGWEWWAKRLAVAGAGTSAAFVILWPYAKDLFESGPLPLAARVEVTAVEEKVKALDTSDDKVHKDLADQLKAQHDDIVRFATQQQVLLSDRLTTTLRNAQASLVQAKALYDKEPTPDNAKLIETLQMEIDEVQSQMRTAVK